MQLLTAQQHVCRPEGLRVLELANDTDPRGLALADVERIDLQFPRFTDGRAFSQAFLLRRRLGYQGEIRATGDVLVDQLPLMARSGFSTAVLRSDQDLAVAERQLVLFRRHYQGDAVSPHPRFVQSQEKTTA